jgi:hypothetical protein
MAEDRDQLIIMLEGDSNSDLLELNDLTAQLRRHLLELDVEDVELVRNGEVPAEAKPVDPVIIGALAVTLVKTPSILKSITGLVETWIRNRPVRTARIVIDDDFLELTAVSPAEHRLLTEAFIDKHAE